MARWLVALAFVLALGAWGQEASAQAACTHWASPGLGTGHAGTQGDPFRPQDFFNLGGNYAGRTLCLNDGTYTGANDVLDPPTTMDGAQGNSVTIRALNDGGVVIDGEHVRTPCALNGNDWVVLEGFDCKRGPMTGNVLSVAGGSDNNIIRRIVAYDGSMTRNRDLLGISDATNNLFEDLGLFGPARKIFLPYNTGSQNNTFRRIWARWEGSIVDPQNKFGMSIHYDSGNSTFENILVTWTGESMPEEYDDIDRTTGQPKIPLVHRTNFAVAGSKWLFGRDHAPSPVCGNIGMFGSLAYVGATTIGPPTGPNRLHGVANSLQSDCFTFRDVMIFMHPSHSGFNAMDGFLFGSLTSNSIAEFTTSVTGQSDSFAAGWSGQASTRIHIDQATLGAVQSALDAAGANPWTGTTGASLCHRYVNKQKTTEPLWPWPMNDRIKAATAAAGRYANGQNTFNGEPVCPSCVGGRAARTATDVTADVESLLGSLPTGCKASSENPPAPPPESAGLITRYYLGEAKDGQEPINALAVHLGTSLTQNYSGVPSQPVYTESVHATGRGLFWNHAAGVGGPSASIDDTPTYFHLNGAVRATIQAVVNLLEVPATTSIVRVSNLHLALLLHSATSVTATFNEGKFATWNTQHLATGTRHIIQVAWDTTHATATSRARLKIDNVDQGAPDAESMPAQDATLSLGTGGYITIGNDTGCCGVATTGTTSPRGTISYVDLWDESLTDAVLSGEYTTLLANDDNPGALQPPFSSPRAPVLDRPPILDQNRVSGFRGQFIGIGPAVE